MPRKQPSAGAKRRGTTTRAGRGDEPRPDEREEVGATADAPEAATARGRARSERRAAGRRARPGREPEDDVREAEPANEVDDDDLDLDEELEDELDEAIPERGAGGSKRGRMWGKMRGRWQDWVLQHLRDPVRAAKLLQRVRAKIDDLREGASDDTWKYLQAIQRLISAWAAGEYREIPVGSLVMIVGAVIYFVSPIDILPDFLPLVGLKDDAAVIAVVLAFVRSDLDRFLEWERTRAKSGKTTGSSSKSGRTKR